ADYGLVTAEEILAVIEAKPPAMELVLTGRDAPASFVEAADLVSEMREVKHHYREGLPARKGIEF
ncbi:MAG: cob(I)yrinic acid a,c-diamide adenosyltransferase, partial [Candidatus Coatesbacteria bacterium]